MSTRKWQKSIWRRFLSSLWRSKDWHAWSLLKFSLRISFWKQFLCYCNCFGTESLIVENYIDRILKLIFFRCLCCWHCLACLWEGKKILKWHCTLLICQIGFSNYLIHSLHAFYTVKYAGASKLKCPNRLRMPFEFPSHCSCCCCAFTHSIYVYNVCIHLLSLIGITQLLCMQNGVVYLFLRVCMVNYVILSFQQKHVQCAQERTINIW